MNTPKTIVTGGAGFIGSHLAEEAIRVGHNVIIVDDLSSGKLENIQALLNLPTVQFVRGSVTDLTLLCEVFRGASYVFHLAAVASVPRSIDDPLETHSVSAGGTLNALVAARQNKVNRFVYASSAAVYGNDPTLPKTETMVTSAASPYAAGKIAGESYCQAFAEVYGLSSVCVRYFNVYGPRQDPGSQYAAVVPRFITDALSGSPLTIYGDGEQTRDLIYVKDVAAATMLVAGSEIVGSVNIASGTSTSITDLAGMVLKAVRANSRPVHAPGRQGEVRHSSADVAKVARAGFRPRYTLETGLTETVRWFSTESKLAKSENVRI